MKITSKTTKQDLIDFITSSVKEVTKKKDKDLVDRMKYTSKMYAKDADKVTRKDLIDVVKDINECLVEEKEEVPVQKEALRKKGAPKNKKEPEPEPEDEDEEEPEEDEEETPKSSKGKGKNKTTGGKKNEEKVVSSSSTTSSPKSLELADTFKEELEIDGVKYKMAHDIKDMKSLYKALEREETIVFAMYWSKRLLKQFSYFEGLVQKPESFPMDLDLTTCIYVSDNNIIAYTVSTYSEGIYSILPSDLVEDKGIRYTNGIEFQIYRQVEE